MKVIYYECAQSKKKCPQALNIKFVKEKYFGTPEDWLKKINLVVCYKILLFISKSFLWFIINFRNHHNHLKFSTLIFLKCS